jgi:hypothetical protein
MSVIVLAPYGSSWHGVAAPIEEFGDVVVSGHEKTPRSGGVAALTVEPKVSAAR